jgi:stearoyl-CoA desaturase (Delta-9 desaturase)
MGHRGGTSVAAKGPGLIAGASRGNVGLPLRLRLVAWGDTAGFVAMHLACLSVLQVGVPIRALVIAALTYSVRCFGITAGFHRYFSHRAFRTGRWFQFLLALAGTLAMQRGVLWWAATHRRHHSVADTADDVHSPHHRTFFYSHCGWTLDPANLEIDARRVRDLARFPELVWLDRAKLAPVAVFAALLWVVGPAEFVWGFVVSTVALWHAILATGSFSHRIGGYRNFDTPDDSRNNRVIAVVLLGEGWHNNHHRSPRAACHGTRRSEPDPIHGVLRGLERLGLVRDLHPRPSPVFDRELAAIPAPRVVGSPVDGAVAAYQVRHDPDGEAFPSRHDEVHHGTGSSDRWPTGRPSSVIGP